MAYSPQKFSHGLRVVCLLHQWAARLAASHLKQGNTEKATKLIRKIWVHGNFGAQQERQFYRQFRRYMTRKDHIERLDRLLWAGKYHPVRRMYRQFTRIIELLLKQGWR